MRSIVFALALAAPVSAVAATYTSPLSTAHKAQQQQAQEQQVFLTFVNYTSQQREVRIGDKQYKMQHDSLLHVYAPVGSVVRVYSTENTKMSGQELMQVSANDAAKSVFLK